jgi:CBS domain-containing protein
VKIGDLAVRDIVSVGPHDLVRTAARAMTAAGVGTVVVLDEGQLAGILTERDVLRAVAEQVDPDGCSCATIMTRDVVTAEPDWEVYEAAAEMAARHIRHLVVAEAGQVIGIVSVRDVLLSGQRVKLGGDHWAVLRDPVTFSVRERRKLQRYLLELRGTREDGLDTADLADLLGLLLGSWSFALALPPAEDALGSLPDEDRAALREAVLAELPELQRSVHPSPGWRRR